VQKGRIDTRKSGLIPSRTFSQLDSSDTHAPNVGFMIIATLLDHLWRHPIGRTDKGILPRHGSRQLPRDAKVGQLDVAGRGEQDVGSFDVSVKFALSVEVVEPFEELSTDDGDVFFSKDARLELGRASTRRTGILS
jgi:hypothetical protein